MAGAKPFRFNDIRFPCTSVLPPNRPQNLIVRRGFLMLKVPPEYPETMTGFLKAFLTIFILGKHDFLPWPYLSLMGRLQTRSIIRLWKRLDHRVDPEMEEREREGRSKLPRCRISRLYCHIPTPIPSMIKAATPKAIPVLSFLEGRLSKFWHSTIRHLSTRRWRPTFFKAPLSECALWHQHARSNRFGANRMPGMREKCTKIVATRWASFFSF
jgi:hypothetical protein